MYGNFADMLHSYSLTLGVSDYLAFSIKESIFTLTTYSYGISKILIILDRGTLLIGDSVSIVTYFFEPILALNNAPTSLNLNVIDFLFCQATY